MSNHPLASNFFPRRMRLGFELTSIPTLEVWEERMKIRAKLKNQDSQMMDGCLIRLKLVLGEKLIPFLEILQKYYQNYQ